MRISELGMVIITHKQKCAGNYLQFSNTTVYDEPMKNKLAEVDNAAWSRNPRHGQNSMLGIRTPYLEHC